MSAISTASSSFLERLRDRLEPPETVGEGSDDAAEGAGNESHPLLIAAAVQHVFTLDDLGGRPDSALLRQLVRNSVPAPGFLDRQGRILARGLRQRTLRRIGIEGARAALAELAPITTPTQAMFHALLAGGPNDLSGLAREELLALQEAAGWLDGVAAPPFPVAEIDRALASGEVWAPFAALLDGDLVGRDADLSVLARFAGLRLDRDDVVVPCAPTPQRLLLIEGVGGIGKSALIAQLMLRFAAMKDAPRLPFAYLACDDPALDVTDPETLLSGAARQILQQLRLVGPPPAEAERAEAAHLRFAEHLRQQSETVEKASKRASSAGSMDARLDLIRDATTSVIAGFAEFAGAAARAMAQDGWQPPCLMVIDTFEEVQYRTPARLQGFWGLVAQLLALAPQLRIVIAGRAPLAEPGLSPAPLRLLLNELSHDAAVDLLSRETGQDSQSLRGLARQIGGNPLNLRLAARVIAGDQHGRGGIAGLTTRRWGVLRVAPELIRGQLYRRVLDHIHDPRVRALAHPGMILRRITPEIISEVLASICEIDLDGPDDARMLFEALAREHTLVRRAEDGSLRYREDVRRPVLTLLTADQPALTRHVHQAAHQFHAGHDDAVSVAEAIYHGLMLGLDADLLDALWQPEAASHLGDAIEELPPRGRIWLAGHSDFDLPESDREAASLEEWEAIVGPGALAVLQQSGSVEALAMLSEREARSPMSPLISIEARCLISLGDQDAAQALLEAALRAAPMDGNPGRKAEYLWLLAKSQWDAGLTAEASESLDDLAIQAAALDSPVPLVQGLAAWLALNPDVAGAEDRRAALADALARCSDADLQREGDVIRRGFAHLGRAAAGRLTRPALTSLSGLYGVLSQPDAFEIDHNQLRSIRDLAVAAQARPETADLAAGVSSALSASPVDLHALLGVLRRPLAGVVDGGLDAAAALAAQMLWHVAQMETATLATATLAGIDSYRMAWEADTAYLAATA